MEPARIHRFVLRLAQPELSAHPKDFLPFYAALYLLAHGAVKVVLVLALLMNRLWAYPWMIGVLLAFIAYQLYQFAVAPTAGLAALTIFDALVVLLTRHEYGRQRRRQRL